MDSEDYIPLLSNTTENNGTTMNDTENSQKLKRKFQHPIKSEDERKIEKEKLQKRRARIIIRNLSYKTNETNLRDHFNKFGDIVELNLLKRSDGKLVGCAFIQYEKINQAAKAIAQCTGKEFLGRPVHLDWSVNKKEYSKHVQKQKHNQPLEKFVADDNDDVVKEEEEEEDDQDNDDDDMDVKSEQESGDDDVDDNINHKNTDNEEEEDHKDEKKIKLIKSDPDGEDIKPLRRISNDVTEGCTVFIKNIPFDANNQDFKKCVLQFGHIYYAILNTDHVSGHSKGTGFVKFRTKESADMCLKAGTEFKIFNQVLDPVPAVSRQDIKKKIDLAKQTQSSDTRNLYLIKEGVIVASSSSAEGVSSSDMAKRLRLEQIKTQMLRNLNRFVARERLTVHNIPPSYDVAKFRKIVEHHTKLKPKECRIMRENKPSIGAPQGKSKGFGFLSFKSHEESLKCLRKLNNNPNIFGQQSRPIVSFSLEDKSVHNIKQKRLERSKEKNPLFQQKKLQRKEKRKEVKAKTKNLAINESKTIITDEEPKPLTKNLRRKALKAKRKEMKRARLLVAATTTTTSNENVQNFAGVLAEPGTGTMRPRWKLNEQAQLHNTDVSTKKKELRKEREKKALLLEKKEVDRTKKRQKTGNEVDNFSFMVDKYKKMMDSNSGEMKSTKKPVKRTKWYTD